MIVTRRLLLAQLWVAGFVSTIPDLTRNAAAETVAYTYDALGRVITATYASGETITYSYDDAGNRTQVVQTATSAPTGTLSASPSTISSGSATLSWTSVGATSATIDNGVGAVTPVAGGSVSVSPSVTTTYTLTLTGTGGTTTLQATVSVAGAALPSGAFSASPTTIDWGGSSTLSWTSASATSASIDNGIGSVSPVAGGSVSVSPTVTTTYLLTLTGPGGTIIKPVTVVVTGFNQNIAITGTGAVNLRTLADNAGYNGAQHAHITFTLASGVTITGGGGSLGDAGGFAIDTGTWPTSTYTIALVLQISGTVLGGGGSGGAGNSGAGAAGGDAIYCRLPLPITVNSGGVVRAGGGGGGGGKQSSSPLFRFGGGGGGGGAPNGDGGEGGSGNNADGSSGSAGTTGGGGAGGAAGGAGATAGGAGGAFATAGTAGASGGGSSGAAGYAIRKNGNTVSVTNSGTITGTVG